ncbi:MAG: oligoendopeptidase F [Phycisphaerales bacterium]|nr:MAG: oligoendopeptidase F [Phycisphaerales bacterium]
MNTRVKNTLWMAFGMIPLLFACTDTANAGETKKVRERSEIEQKHLWATENIFPNVEAWEAEFAAVEKKTDELAALEGTLVKGPGELLHALKLSDHVEPRLSRVYLYASLLSDQDLRAGEMQAMKARARTLLMEYNERMSWMAPELTTIPTETVQSWMRQNKDLALYEQFFDDLFRQKQYILSPREEELMAMAGQVRSAPSSAYRLLANADIQFPTITDEEGNSVELSDSAFYIFMRSTDRRVRKDAYNGIVGTYSKYRNTAAALLNGSVQSDIFSMKARGHESCLAAALHNSNIPVGVYNTLVNTVNENLHLLHRYQEIRKRALKANDGIHAYDLFAPLVEGQEFEYTYEQAVDTIVTALEPLGNSYLEPMNKGFASRWVDVFPTKGKRSGAYSSGTYLTQPYILLNFHGGYDSVSTLAHEMGHSMHSYFSRGTQPYVYASYDTFCAEVASTCNEILLQNYILKRTKDPKKKLYLLVEFLEGVRGALFRQTMFSEFEQRIHEMAEAGQPLTADSLGQTYGEIMKKYYGPAYTHDDVVDNYWIRIPHFYRGFYVYKYSTSHCAASNIAARILKGTPGATDAYLKFLHSGSSKYPVDLLKMAGVDMTTPEPVRDAMELFELLLDQTEEALVQIGS